MKQPFEHLRTLTGFGPRPIGSPANQAAADYIRQVFTDAGLAVEEQPYACTAWEHAGTRLEQGGDSLEAAANPFSLPCDLTAPMVGAGTLAELEQVDAAGKVLVLFGDLAKMHLSPKSWFLIDEREQRIIELLENKKPAALIGPPTETLYYSHLTMDWELDLPAATVPAPVLRRLLSSMDEPVHLAILARRQPVMACNIVGRTLPQEKRLVLVAHFDTVIDTVGATDNGSGSACLLSLAQSLSATDLPFQLEFLAINGEEYLPMGDDEYLRRSQDYFGQIVGCINIDGVGLLGGCNSLTALAASEAQEEKAKAVLADFPGAVWVDPWPESNHSTFAMRGIPALALTSVGERRVAHHPADNLDVMSAVKLMEAVELVRRLACEAWWV